MSIEGSESISSNNFYNLVFLQKDSTRQALKKVSMVAGAVLLASALAPCAFASVPLLAKVTIMKSAGALSCFILAKLIPRGRDHMALSPWFQSQPENAKAEAQQILNILKEKDLSRPFGLDIQNYPNITSLPSVLQNCTRLTCGGCTSLRTLPDLPNCEELNCYGCTSLHTLPNLSLCTSLECGFCTSLRELPELPVCTELNCFDCTNLQALPSLPTCTKLICPYCPSLQALPELPACTMLDCHNCTSLRTLPALPVCTELFCFNCTSLQALPALPACTILDCFRCTSLQALPELPGCETLNCSNCTNLLALPQLPVCTRLDCSDCTLLHLPELPACTTLRCSRCPSLQALPELPVCTELSCYNCARLRALPRLPACTTLRCFNCASLRTLPALPVCTELHCFDCTSLQALPELPACTTLSCFFCTSLRTLPRLPVCSQISIRACPSLQNLPPLPSCMSLVLDDCPQLRSIPDVPEGCNIDMRNRPLIPPIFDSAPAQQPNPYQGQLNRAAEGTLQGALDFWSELLPQGQEPLPRAEALKFDDNTRARDQRLFEIFLNRLQETADFRQANPQNLALRVAAIVRDMVASEKFLQKAIWALDSANDACGDRVATGIESLEILSLIHGQNKPETDVDTACLAIRLARLDQVRKKAIALNPGPEGLETVLFLQLKLKDRLKLPLQTGGMLYERVGQVSAQDVNRTAQEILAATSTDEQLYGILVNSEVWTDFLHREPNDVYYNDVRDGLTIIKDSGEGDDYSAKLAALEKKPTDAWTGFLDNVGPPNTSFDTREALQWEVIRTLREECPSLTGTEYSVALTKLTQQIDKKKTIDWLTANGGALRAKLN